MKEIECVICNRARLSLIKLNGAYLCAICSDSHNKGIVKYTTKNPKPNAHPSLIINAGKSLYNLSNGDVYLRSNTERDRIEELVNIPIIQTIHKIEGIRTVNKFCKLISKVYKLENGIIS